MGAIRSCSPSRLPLGAPYCTSATGLEEVLRRRWGSGGCVVSGCGAIRGICHGHKVVATAGEVAAHAVRHGCDLNCGATYPALVRGKVAQLSLCGLEPRGPAPLRAPAGFTRLRLQPGEARTLSFSLSPQQVARVHDEEDRVLDPGIFGVSVGGGQPGPGSVSGRFRMGQAE